MLSFILSPLCSALFLFNRRPYSKHLSYITQSSIFPGVNESLQPQDLSQGLLQESKQQRMCIRRGHVASSLEHPTPATRKPLPPSTSPFWRRGGNRCASVLPSLYDPPTLLGCPPAQRIHISGRTTRFGHKLNTPLTRTSRYQNSPIPYLTRLLNNHSV